MTKKVQTDTPKITLMVGFIVTSAIYFIYWCTYCTYLLIIHIVLIMLFFAILYPPNSGKLLPNRKHPQAASAKKEMEQVLVLKTQEPMNKVSLNE